VDRFCAHPHRAHRDRTACLGPRGGAGRRKSWLKASPGNYLKRPMPKLSQNWSVPFSPRAALCCAMDSSTGPAPIRSSNHPRNLGFTSTELPNERWRRWASQRASSSLSTERAAAYEAWIDGYSAAKYAAEVAAHGTPHRRTPAASRRAISRKPSCLISCSHRSPEGQLVGLCGEARRDEPRREGTLQHAETNRIGQG
jgi:hypothetical protein